MNDGPQKLCSLCISYMKHAYNFKIQAFRNLGLMAMKNANPPVDMAEDIESLCKDYSVQGMDHLLKEAIIDTSDDNLEGVDGQEDDEEVDKTSTGIFSYAHTSFEEDDITQLDVFQSNQISFYLPETFKERKCTSCRRRFMFEDSYNEHIKECISLKLVSFIKEMTQLLYLRENRAVSSHEFIRRVIFGIKKSVQTVVDYDEGVKKEVERVNKQQRETENHINTNPKKRETAADSIGPKEYFTKLNVNDVFSNSQSESDNLTNTSNTPSPIQNFFMRCPDCCIIFENVEDLEKHNYQFHNKKVNASSIIKLGPRTKSTEKSSVAEMKKILRIRKETKPNYDHNLSSTQLTIPFKTFVKNQNIDVIKNNLLCDDNTTSDDGESCNSVKKVKCSKCFERFLTISHLDIHIAKKHTRSPVSMNFNESEQTAKSRRSLRYPSYTGNSSNSQFFNINL